MNMMFDVAPRSEILSTLGARLRAQRLAQNLAQARLADMAGVSLGALRNLEHNGRCSLETLVAVVSALGLKSELQDLFVLKRQSIAQMERAQTARERQRASRRQS